MVKRGNVLPQTLHGKLCLLAYTQTAGRFEPDGLRYFGFALRAAMIADLCLYGNLADYDVAPAVTPNPVPDDPVLAAMLDQIRSINPISWQAAVAQGHQAAPRSVQQQLETDGWLIAHRRRVLGVSVTRYQLRDVSQVSRLHDDVNEALADVLNKRCPTDDSGLLVLGLICVSAEIPHKFCNENDLLHAGRGFCPPALAHPLKGLCQAITAYEAQRGGMW
ncbi:GOLPH3/VPS74 family protein [Mycobacteroides abscessus]|uniref:GOLPH3/VPS74 family protein n=1 Tax=Mycobacteroides abscessus TaxID=36809 RepID=UPI0009A77B41|nr:GPP34 family phosphoprotein [Mycobacteroides abscessus]RIT48816.1 GPP34 family phosphoprotein [Mycobacteroides abscessus]SKT87703.1 Uncharacterised protein [Mycobacteroides abscessus subsp. massiliense]SKU07709.1 Uncharacterised protein [Mycobacteroides abscessus subsp. massiliense]